MLYGFAKVRLEAKISFKRNIFVNELSDSFTLTDETLIPMILKRNMILYEQRHRTLSTVNDELQITSTIYKNKYTSLTKLYNNSTKKKL